MTTQRQADPTALERDVSALYQEVIESWNMRRADSFAELFAVDGHIVGFDGTMEDSAADIRAHLGAVFSSHETARYVAKVKQIRLLGSGAALVRAVVGMVPPGASDIKPEVNAVQTLVAELDQGRWRVVMLQSTPAAFHGRPDAIEALNRELRALLT